MAHTAFHAAVVAACGSPWLLRIREQLFSQHERYRWLVAPLAKVDRDLDAEHSAIAHAALARRADEAVERMDAHLRLTEEIIAGSPLARALDDSETDRLAS